MDKRKQKKVLAVAAFAIACCLVGVVIGYELFEQKEVAETQREALEALEEVDAAVPEPVRRGHAARPAELGAAADTLYITEKELGDEGEAAPEDSVLLIVADSEEGRKELAAGKVDSEGRKADLEGEKRGSAAGKRRSDGSKGDLAGVREELATLYIPLTKSLFSEEGATAEAFLRRIAQPEGTATGKTYFRGENGLIESFLKADERGAVREILVCFDAEGREVDRMEIGALSADGSERKYATVLVNRLSVFERTVDRASGRRREVVTEYTIMPSFHLKKGKTFSKLL